MERYSAKLGWPVSVELNPKTLRKEIKYNLRDDLKHFVISQSEMAIESHMSHQRLSNIVNNTGSCASVEEIHNITVSFNRIIKRRTRLSYLEENFIIDNQ